MNNSLPETREKCLKILEENVEILANLEMDLEDENEDELVPNMELHQLYDMLEDSEDVQNVYSNADFTD